MPRRRARRPQPTTDRRSPEQRLEALVHEANRERALRMLGRIRADLRKNPEPGPWIAAARTLSERLIISDNSFHYFADLFTEGLVFSAVKSDPELDRITADMEANERAHGLREGEYWHVDNAPDDWRSLNDAWDRRANEIVATALREFGHADLAALREQNPGEFDRRSKQGLIDLWGEDEEDHDTFE